MAHAILKPTLNHGQLKQRNTFIELFSESGDIHIHLLRFETARRTYGLVTEGPPKVNACKSLFHLLS